MKLRCPYCGMKLEKENYCPRCQNNVTWTKSFLNQSQYYCVQGYKMATERNLTLAVQYLTKAIKIYKYNIVARNLLGLIYYEVGQVGEALKEWIVSQSLQKDENMATNYLKEVQENPKQLTKQKDAIRLYNEALIYLEEDNLDMGMIRLKKAGSLNKQLVKAKTLLALCYIKQKQYHKANEQVKNVLSIDAGDVEALRYYHLLSNEDTQKIEPYERKYEVSQETNINTSTINLLDRSKYFRRYMAYFGLGVGASLIIYHYLVFPSKVQEYKATIKQLTASETQLSGQVSQLTKEYQLKVADLETNQKALQAQVTDYENKFNDYEQKEKLEQANRLAEEGNYKEAAKLIYNVASSSLDEEERTEYEGLKARVYPQVANTLYDEGLNAYYNEAYQDAVSLLEEILLYEPKERVARKTLYYLGCNYQAMGSVAEAKQYFNKVIAEYGESYEAQLATNQLNEIVNNE